MLAREHDPPVDLAQIVVMLGPFFLSPVAGASEREWHAMPRYGDAVFELGRVLRMNAGTYATARATLSAGAIEVNSYEFEPSTR